MIDMDSTPRAHYVCQTEKLLAKYVKIIEVDSGHILELDKSMENRRFMLNMNDHIRNSIIPHLWGINLSHIYAREVRLYFEFNS